VALTDVPSTFQSDNEEEVRVAIAQYFRELGFEATGMSFEDNFCIRLGHASLELGIAPKRTHLPTKQRTQIAGRSDLLLTRHRQPLAIVETKAPDHPLTEQDAFGAMSHPDRSQLAPSLINTQGIMMIIGPIDAAKLHSCALSLKHLTFLNSCVLILWRSKRDSLMTSPVQKPCREG